MSTTDRQATSYQEPEEISSADGQAAAERFRHAVEGGQPWAVALLEAIAGWTDARESHRGRSFDYFIGGEAFDWLLLAERLCEAAGGLIPDEEKEELLFTGKLPSEFDLSRFKDLMGVEKYRGYLNYFYGITVEESLQLAAELEVEKRHLSNGHRYWHDFSEEAFQRVYRSSRSTLIEAFRKDRGYAAKDSMGLSESKEFTYWLFNYRLKTSDQAKTASDTRKGLMQLRRMEAASGVHAGRYIDQSEVDPRRP